MFYNHGTFLAIFAFSPFLWLEQITCQLLYCFGSGQTRYLYEYTKDQMLSHLWAVTSNYHV